MIDLHDMSRVVGLSPSDILSIVDRGPLRYKEYSIPKRGGGERRIAQPSTELKAIQRYIADKVLLKLPVSEHATAYREGISIRDNALKHVGMRFLLKTDFEAFFHNFRTLDLVELFRKNGIVQTPRERAFFRDALFWQPKKESRLTLAMGAPTSPLLTNLMLVEFDSYIGKIAAENGAIYTRYADDIAISANSQSSLVKIEELMAVYVNQLKRPVLKFNNNKRGLYGPGQKKIVTGLILTPDGRVSLGRDRKRTIDVMFDYWRKGKIADEREVERLRGLIAFANSCEPMYMKHLRTKYGSGDVDTLLTRPFQSFWTDPFQIDI